MKDPPSPETSPYDATIPQRDAARLRAEKLGGPPPVQDWDRYELLELLGRGGMGSVYKARDRRLGRLLAVKFIHSPEPYIMRRFLQEARAQARVHHPNVCQVVEAGEVEGQAYIAMELVDGLTLSQAMPTMSLMEKVLVVKTVAEAVHEAHRLGIVHRDIKPGNIMVEETKGASGSRSLRPVLMDFGLAREAGDGQGLTESGAVMGTPSYMPPEQARGDARKVDARSDVYSLGATLYHLLAGEPPFVQDATGNVLLKVLVEEAPPLRGRAPDVPEALEVIVGKCLSKEPHLRYASAADLAADLDRFLNRERVIARRLGLVSRIYWRGRRNKPMAFAVVALCVSLVAFAGYGVRTTVVDARNEAIARKRTELAQKLAKEVKDLEWLMRSAYLVPLHDASAEKEIVRARMADIGAEMKSFGGLAAGLDHYALGRGHFALEQWAEARAELVKAEAAGVGDRELHYALGRVLGELYSRALEDARRSGDKSYFEKRKAELDAEYLAPALSHLERCRGLQTVSASYLDGLVDFYNRRYDDALRDAELARKSIPWLYEAAKLEGDVFMARALDAKDHGDDDEAGRRFEEAVQRYEQAAEIGRSDHQVYEALAEAWIRQEEMDLYRGRDPRPKLDKALAAAGKALVAAPAESEGHTKKAFALGFQAQYAQNHAAPREVIERLFQEQIAAGEQAVALHPGDAYARDITGAAYLKWGQQLLDLGQPAQPALDKALAHLEEAIRHNPRFPWAYNDYGLALGFYGEMKRQRNEDPQAYYRRAIDAIKRASQLDDQYVLAYANASAWLNELASWKAEHGEDPESVALETAQAADRAIAINRRQPLAYGNAGSVLLTVASYRLDAGRDGREPAQRAIDRFKDLLAIDPGFVVIRRQLARAHVLLAGHERAQGADPGPSLEAGLEALSQCYRASPGDAESKAVEAQIRAEQASFARQRGQPFEEALERAQKLATEAVLGLPDRADLWLILGQVCLQRAEALSASPRPATPSGPVLDEGLRGIEKALDKAPGVPRALAVRGALLLRKAEVEADPERKKAALERGRESLSKAFAGNPLLERRYGAAAGK